MLALIVSILALWIGAVASPTSVQAFRIATTNIDERYLENAVPPRRKGRWTSGFL